MAEQHTPTRAQLLVLENIAAGRRPASHLSGRAAWGGFDLTWRALITRGWIDRGALTDAGRAALQTTGDKP